MTKLIVVILVSLLSASCFASGFDTQAKYAIITDADNGAILLEKNADQPSPPSSMSKLMTTYIVFELLKKGSLKLTDTLFVSPRAWKMQGSKMFVDNNSHVSVENLLRGVVVQSGNDACVVLAEGVMGSEELFVEAMNKKAAELGLSHSHFSNVSGWPDPEHVMSVRDLAILADRLLKDFPEYYHYFAEREFTYNNIRQPNRNTLLFTENGVDGLKTGHTDSGGYGVVISAKRGERRLIIVVNGLKNQSVRHAEVERLLQYGFQHFTQHTLYKAGDTIAEVPTWLGRKSHLKLTVAEPVRFTTEGLGKDSYKAIARYKEPVVAPIEQGQELGSLEIKYLIAGREYSKNFTLVAAEDLHKKPFLLRLFDKATYVLQRFKSKGN